MAGKRKKKQTLTLLILLLIVIALGGLYWYLSTREEPEDEEEDTTTEAVITICPLAEEDLTEISFTNAEYSASVTLLENGTYILNQDEDFPLNQTKAGYVFSYLDTTATSLIAESGDITEYGLDEPQITIRAKAVDGGEYTLYIGSRVGTASKTGYYAKVEGSEAIYLVPATLYTYYAYTEKDLIAFENTPSIDTTTITELSVESESFGSYAMQYSSALSEVNTGLVMSNWIITSPYDTWMEGDDDSITTMLGNYETFSFTQAVDYRTENLSLYGLDDPSATLHIIYTTEETVSGATVDDEDIVTVITNEYTLYFGDQNESGLYYVKQNASDRVYLMTEANVQKLLDIDEDEMLNPYINLIYINTLSDMTITFDSGEIKAVMLYETTTDDEGNTTTENAGYVVNGVTLTDDTAFTILYQVVIGAKMNGVLPKGTKADTETLLSLKFNRTSESYRDTLIEYKSYDNNNDAVCINGVAVLTIDKRDVEAMIKELEAFTVE